MLRLLSRMTLLEEDLRFGSNPMDTLWEKLASNDTPLAVTCSLSLCVCTQVFLSVCLSLSYAVPEAGVMFCC